MNGITTPFASVPTRCAHTCHGNGAAPGTSPETCPQCHGSGTIAVDQGPFSFSQVCPTCGGRGHVIPRPCPTCHGRGVEVRDRDVKVRIPAGVADGSASASRARGGAGANGGPAGDLYVIVHVQPHALFGRNGNDLTLQVPVTFAEATLGANVKVPTLDGQVTVRVPPGTPSGKVMRVRGKGSPTATARAAGDLLVTVDVQVPTELDDEQRAAIESLTQVPRRPTRVRRCSGRRAPEETSDGR